MCLGEKTYLRGGNHKIFTVCGAVIVIFMVHGFFVVKILLWVNADVETYWC